MQASDKSSNNQGKKDSGKDKNNSGKGKNSSDKGKGDKKKHEFVDFKSLTGKEKLKALNVRNYCTGCMQKKEGKHNCPGKDHTCKLCDGKGHLDKCCAFPKKKD